MIWRRERKSRLGGAAERIIKLELTPLVENIPDKLSFMEVYNPVTLTEGETHNFDEWWKMLAKLETNI